MAKLMKITYLEFEKEETCSVPRPFPETSMLDFQDRSPWLDSQKEVDLSYDLFRVDAVTLDELQSRTIALRSRKHEKGLKVHFQGVLKSHHLVNFE